MSTQRLLVSALITALVTSCAVLPEPKRDEIQQKSVVLANLKLANAWKAGSANGSIEDNWIASFNDKQLDAMVAEAMLNNPDLLVAATRVEQSALYVDLAKAALKPVIGFGGTGGGKMGGGEALQAAVLGISWEIDLWGRIRYGRNAAMADYDSAQADFQFARQSLAALVAKSWFTVNETWLQQKLAADVVKSSQKLVDLAKQRRQVGVGSEYDVALAIANLSSLQDSEKQVQLAHSQSLRAMELILGRYPAAELAASHQLTSFPNDMPAGLPLEMLERRPDIIAAERRVAAAFDRVGEAKAARLPQITLSANIASLKSDILELQSGFSNPTGGFGAKLLAPIYQGGALQAQVEIRTVQQKEAVLQYAKTALRALGDVESALALSQTLSEREVLLTNIVAENQRAFQFAVSNYTIGNGDARAVEQQRLSLYSTQLALLRIQSEKLSQRANLYLALGGSFETVETASQ
ncbi:MAG: efflux transporter outer membrane subunit [Arenimonas sp.]|nr:efflux transporter outer membrane subunit [Arenimonas sp.]